VYRLRATMLRACPMRRGCAFAWLTPRVAPRAAPAARKLEAKLTALGDRLRTLSGRTRAFRTESSETTSPRRSDPRHLD
jgi:hypothetical protein